MSCKLVYIHSLAFEPSRVRVSDDYNYKENTSQDTVHSAQSYPHSDQPIYYSLAPSGVQNPILSIPIVQVVPVVPPSSEITIFRYKLYHPPVPSLNHVVLNHANVF